MGKRRKVDRRGRPPKADAKRRATTAAQRRPAIDPGTAELAEKRKALTGQDRIGGEFPLDVLLARGLITQDQRDEGLRFALLAWWLYGFPSPGCEALYERMVAGGIGPDFAPRMTSEDSEERLKLIEGNKRRFARMVRALYGTGPGSVENVRVAGKEIWYRQPSFLPLAGTLFEAVRNAAQFMRLPRAVALFSKDARERRQCTDDDLECLVRLRRGLRRLVQLRNAEDRHWLRQRKRAVQQLLTRDRAPLPSSG